MSRVTDHSKQWCRSVRLNELPDFARGSCQSEEEAELTQKLQCLRVMTSVKKCRMDSGIILNAALFPSPLALLPSAAFCLYLLTSEIWRNVNVPTLFHVVVDEVLQQELIDVWPRTATSDRPKVVGEDSERPMRKLNERYQRRSQREYPLSENGIRSRGCHERKPDAPDNLFGFNWRQKKVGFRSPKPYSPLVGKFGYGCHIRGRMMRLMSTHFLVRCTGMTGSISSAS